MTKKSKKSRVPKAQSAADAPAPTSVTSAVVAPAGQPPAAPAPAPKRAPHVPKAKPEAATVVAPTPILGPGATFADKLARTPARLRWLALGAIVLAWVAGFGLRAAWLSNNDDLPNAKYEDKRLLTTADAYYYASGVKLEVEGGVLEDNRRVPRIDESVVIAIGAAVVNVLGVAVEDASLWLPAILAPLVAVPLLLLGLMFGQLAWGFIAALVSALGFSYWNRTVPGYFDTDMVTITYVVGVIALVIAGFWRRKPWLGSIGALLAVVAPYMHPGSERVLAAVVLGSFGYAVVFARKEPRAYRVALALAVSFLPVPMWVRALVIVALEVGLTWLKVPLWSLIGLAAALLVAVVLKNPAMDLVLGILGIRFRGGGGGGGGPGSGAQFMGLGETVAELANPSLDKLGERIAGGTALLVTGGIGYLLACWPFRPLLMLLPLLLLGTVQAATGQRYTIFAVPVIALGNAWLLVLAGRVAARFWAQRGKLVAIAAPLALAPIIVAPAVMHGLDYPPRTAIGTNEATQLAGIASKLKAGDFMLSWWDYSYGIWFFAGARTLVDGMKQTSDVWVPAEMLFTSSQREAATLARLAAEEQVLHPPFDDIIDDVLERWNKAGHATEDFIPALREGRVPLPAKTREVYFYLPWKFLQIAPNVARLREAKGLMPAGEVSKNPFIVVHHSAQGQRPVWVYVPAEKVVTGPRGERVKVWKTVEVGSDNGRIVAKESEVDPEGRVVVVAVRHAGLTIFMDRPMYASTLTQLLVLARPDNQYFEPVSFTRGGAIYRVKL